MIRVTVILGLTYALTLGVLLTLRLVPGLPWAMLLSFVVHSLPLALSLAYAVTQLQERVSGRWSMALAPFGIAAGLALVWFFNWTIQPVAIVAVVLFSVWQFVVGAAKTFIKPLAFCILALLLGYGTIWNINYLAGYFLPEETLRDQALLDFDVAFFRAACDHDVGGQANFYPVVRHPTSLRFLEHAYMFYYDQIFLVLFVLLYKKADLTRFFSVMFGSFLIGIPVFLLYPTIGPFTFAPETILTGDWRGSSTYSLMKNVLDDWQAVRTGGNLGGYGYFIAMPSMHVAVATILQVFAWQCRPAFWLLLPVNLLLFLSTFLLGWHYVLDAPAGIAVALVTLSAARLWDWRRGSSVSPDRGIAI